MGSRKKKDRRNERRWNPHPQKSGEVLHHEHFTMLDTREVQNLLDEGFTWSAAPRGALSGIRVDGRPYILPLETVVDGRPHHLVLFQEEFVCGSRVGFVREQGLLIEDPECETEKFIIFPALVPTETIPASYRGQLVDLSSPAYTAKALSVIHRLPEGSPFRAVVDSNHWWFETAGSAWEHAVSLAYELHLGRSEVA